MRLLREPLVHFLMIGAVLFALYGMLHSRAEPEEDTITVSAAHVALLQEQWLQQSGRSPTQQELQWLIDQYIREEVLYREAKTLGLDRDDTIVRRRIVQKMDFLVADIAALAEPSERELQTFFAAHREQYREPVRLSFTHIYFNPDIRDDHIQQDAEQALTMLRGQKPLSRRAPERGDRFMLSADYAQRTQADVTREFGQAFADQLFVLPLGQWHGPIESGYGLHLVRILERSESTVPEFSTVRAKVKDDLIAATRRAANDAAYLRLRERYKIMVAQVPDVTMKTLSQGVRQ
jgi:peptidyl-prolyl cis-trans isomerase C